MGNKQTLISGMLVCVVLLFVADVYFSLSMYTSIPDEKLDKRFYGMVSAVFAVVVLLLAAVIPSLFRRGTLPAVLGCILAAIALYYLEAMSLSSSFGRTATVLNDKEQALINASGEKQAAAARLASGQAQAESLARFADASTTSAYTRALPGLRAKLTELEQSRPMLTDAAARYMAADCTPKTDGRGLPYTSRAAEYCPQWQASLAAWRKQLEAQRQKVSQAENYLDGHQKYLGQLEHNSLLHEAHAKAGKGDTGTGGALPMFAGLSKVDLAIHHYGSHNPESIKNAFIARFTVLVSLLQPLLVFLIQAMRGQSQAMLEAELERAHELRILATLQDIRQGNTTALPPNLFERAKALLGKKT